ncbi:MAG: NnrS family protein, partial [Acetobacterales bacterium]
NLPRVAALALLLAGNAMMHASAVGWLPDEGHGWRLGLAVAVMLIALVGGRIVPSFTRNWLVKRGEGALPAAFGGIDRAALASTAVALLCWVVAPEGPVTGALLALAALAQVLRLARWCGHRTGAEPLVWVLHLGYGWMPVGLALLAAAAWSPGMPETAAVHALTAGAIGTMTLAVMTRATLGHTGNPLLAGPATTAVYLLVAAAAAGRVAAALLPSVPLWLTTASGLAWLAAFLGFAVIYGRLLLR